MYKPVMYVGPSMTNSKLPNEINSLFDVRPPVKRGDIPDLIKSNSKPDQIIIVDGIFKASPSVGHKEILDAMEVGVKVDGVSSMGAIRAFELRGFGMRGHGKIFGMLDIDDEVTDDEITLIHLPRKPYNHFSVPLVNVRAALERISVIPSYQNEIIQHLKSYYFGDRTVELVIDLLSRFELITETQKELLVSEISDYDQKTRDLDEFVIKFQSGVL